MSDNATWPHEDLMSENGITTADLEKKTLSKIAKFKTETDNDLKESLDEVIYADVKEVVEKKNKEAKAAAMKDEINKRKDAKKAPADVSGAPTAIKTGDTPPPPKDPKDTPPPPPKAGRGVMGTILGLGHK